MIQRWILVLISLCLFAAGVDFATAQGFAPAWTGSGSASATVPTLVAGTATPQSEDATHPSMSRWAPSCLDSTWGIGCNTGTQTCTAPSSGTPVETCQPPLQINVTGGSGNGTTATINYYSATNYAFPVGTPLNVSNSAYWNTPQAGVVSYLQSTSGHCATSGHTCITLGLAPMTGIGPVTAGSVPFIPGTPVYISGTTGTASEYDGTTNWGFGWNQLVSSGSYNNSTGALSITLANPYFGASPTGLVNLGGLTFTGGTCTSPCGLNGWLTLASSGSGGTVLNFSLAAGLATANLTVTGGGVVQSAGESGPNGKWTPDGTWSGSVTSLNLDVSSVFPYGFQGSWGCQNGDAACLVSSGNLTNYWGYNGVITQPWVVTASSCSGTSCSVSFNNPTSCASSCVTPGLGGTQIVAGQFSPVIMAWDSGPVAPYAVENGTLTKCVAAFGSANNPMQYVKMALNGGAFVSAKYMLDPWGVGAASNSHDPDQASVTNNTYVYCAQFAASSVADGEYEIRAIGCATAGPCGQLTSAITANVTNGSPTLTSTAHYQNDTNHLAVTQSVDPNFPTYNFAYDTLSSPITATGAVYNSGSPPSVTYTYNPGSAILPIKVGMPVNITGFATNLSCPITSASGTGNTITYNYSGACDFPVGTTVNIASMATGVTQTENISSVSYNATSGLLTVTLASALWGTTPGYNGITQWNIAGTTGTGTTYVNQGEMVQVGNSGSGTVLTFQLAAGLTISINPSTGTVSNPNNYSGNGLAVPVTATDGATYIQATGMSLSSFGAGGTITANWNEYCFPTAVTSTTITCPLPSNSPSTTVATEGQIAVNANLMCVVGGEADNYPPFNPAFQLQLLMDPNHFQLINWMSASAPTGNPSPGTTCSNIGQNQTGCPSATCGVPGSKNSTIWLYRKDAGTLEYRNNGSGTGLLAGVQNDGSFWGYVNAGGSIKEQSAYVDQWNPSAVATGPFSGLCNGSPYSAQSWNATPPTYVGSYCVNAAFARASLYWGTTLNVSATTGNSGGCSTFQSSTFNNADIVQGVPVIFLGIDPGTNGDGSNALFANTSVYWVHSNASGTLTLAATPGGACINETATMSGIKLQQDLGFHDIFYKCNTSLGCSGSNPETVTINGNNGGFNSTAQFAKSGWFNFAPDYGNGTTQHEVTLPWQLSLSAGFALSGVGAFEGGRVRSSLDRSNTDLSLNLAVSLTPTLGTIQPTGGSLAGSAETLTWSAPTNCSTPYAPCTTNGFVGAQFQAPDATGLPGQSIVISGLANNWNCGTVAAPCTVTAATPTSVTFTNPNSPTGSFTPSGTPNVAATTLSIEVAAGTFPNLNPSGDNCTNVGSGNNYVPITPPGGAVACVAQPGVNNVYGYSAGLWPFYLASSFSGSFTQVSNSGCLLQNSGQVAAGYEGPFVSGVTPSSGVGINDVITLSTFSTTNPVYAFNNCSSVQFMTGGSFNGNGAVDGWESETTVNGPNFWENGTGTQGNLLSSTGGVFYSTDLAAYNADTANDNTGYTWGDSSIWNLGICHVAGSTGFHIRCAGTWKFGPESIGAVNYSNPPSVIHSYATYANYIANNPILCGGVDCITTSSTIFKLSDNGGGLLAAPATLGWSITIPCNFSWPITANITNVNNSSRTVTWMDKANGVVMMSGGASGTCNPITSARLYTSNSYHTDLNFFRAGPFDIPSSQAVHEFANRLPWTTANNIIIEQEDTRLSGDQEGLFTEGGNQDNIAVVNSFIAGVPGPVLGGGASGILTNSYGSINWLNLNDQAGSSVVQFAYNANTNPSYIGRAPIIDTYYINLNSGPQFYGFPINTQPDVTYGGMRYSSISTWSFRAESNEVVGSPLNPSQWWPSPAWAVDASGNPITGSGQPGYNNLGACPWYCAATDTENSLN